MHPSDAAKIHCPYCGEELEIAIEASAGAQEYVEDCQVCCKPMQIRIRVSAVGTSHLDVRSEDE